MIYSGLISFIGSILYSRYKEKIQDPSKLFGLIFYFIKSKFNFLHSFPERFIGILLRKFGLSGFSNNLLIIHGKDRRVMWYRAHFKCKDTTSFRDVQIMFCPMIPNGIVLCSEALLFNIKNSLSVISCDELFVEMLLKPLKTPKPIKRAKCIKTSAIEGCKLFDTMILETAVEYFLKGKQFCYKKDVLSINIGIYSPFAVNNDLYLCLEDVSGDEDLGNDGFFITSETSVLQLCNVQSFIPRKRYLANECSQSSILSTILPNGLESHYNVLSKWFRPFFRKSIKDLKPVFVLSGTSGVGKKILLEACSKNLGVHYINIDCNDLISPTSVQMHSNFKNAFTRIAKSSPCVTELSNIELMCYDTESNDIHQLLSALSTYISTLESASHTSVLVFTCSDFAALPERLTSLVLAHHHMSLPNDSERVSMIKWLTSHYGIKLSKLIEDFLIPKTASYSLADLRRLLAVADLQRYKASRTHFDLYDFTEALDGMSKVDKAKVGDIEWEDVGGVEDIKKAVLSSIETGKLGGLRRTGLLLHGPPGTGKTLLARAVANQVSAAFIPVKGPELLNMYIGQSEANVRQIFSRARDAAPCILFFDELDSLAPSRGNQSSGGVMDRVVSQLLSEMDSLEVEDDVFVLAATNRPDLIDPALLRPGRLDKMIYVGPFKSKEDKMKVLKAITRKFQVDNNFNYDKIVELFPPEVTGAQISAICYDAWMDSAKQIISSGEVTEDSKVVVSMDDFISSISTTNINF